VRPEAPACAVTNVEFGFLSAAVRDGRLDAGVEGEAAAVPLGKGTGVTDGGRVVGPVCGPLSQGAPAAGWPHELGPEFEPVQAGPVATLAVFFRPGHV
jgi:hypothetical protein